MTREGQGAAPTSDTPAEGPIGVRPATDGVAVEVPGDPSLRFVVQWVPRRDLDPRGPVPVPGRPNTQDFVGLREIVLGGTASPGLWIWDNREHQYWAGHDGSFLPRHAPIDEQGIRGGAGLEAWIRYQSEGVVTRVTWTARPADSGPPFIDAVTDVTNDRAEDLAGYSQLIANYHPDTGPAWYIAPGGAVVQAPDHAVLLVSQDAQPRLDAIDAEWTRHPAVERCVAALPILVSGPLWGGWHHVLLGEAATVWGLVTWRSDTFPFRALDTLIGPPGPMLAGRSRMRSVVRHAFVRTPIDGARIHDLWRSFCEALA